MKKSIVSLVSLAFVCCITSCTCQKTELPQNLETAHQETKTMQKITTASGLSYKTITETSAAAQKAQRGQRVLVHYTGWLADQEGNPRLDKQFDSSYKRNQPFQFTLGAGEVIKGWDEGVEGMAVGEKRQLVIPATLAYGNQAVGNVIPANSTLVFEVELLGVQ